MADRTCQLPNVEDLSKQQEDARDLPDDGQHLIVGGPGTGKTVVALLRVRRLERAKTNYVFLVFNKLLLTASKQLYGDNLNSQQWQAWFIAVYKNYTKATEVPFLGNEKLNFDWAAIASAIAEQPAGDINPLYLIIDEGQDLPAELYVTLASMGYVNFYVVADQNQQIVPGRNSARRDIENALALQPGETIELTENYRNNYPIAALARSFYTGDPASPPPALPGVALSGSRPLLFDYASAQFDAMMRRILTRHHNYPHELICIITPDNKVREKYFNRLCQMVQNRELGFIDPVLQIQTYAYQPSQQNRALVDPIIRFDRGGIAVINSKSCKGLESDLVFIADVNRYPYRETDPDSSKRLFYVMVARAISRIIMLRERQAFCPVEAILPTDTAILERK